MKLLDPILYPLARLAIRRGWLFPTLADRLRHAYLAASLGEAGTKATDSRLSVLTGLQRRDIARLRSEQNTAPPSHRQPLAEIISKWWSDDTYNADGIPVQGGEGSFTHLARSVRKDVHARTFLDVLIETGAVEETDGILRLLTRTYRPLAGSDDQLGYLTGNVGDHLSVAVANVVEEANGYDVSVHYQGLSPAAIDRLDSIWREKLSNVMNEINDIARALPTSDNGTHRFRAGAYFHKEAR